MMSVSGESSVQNLATVQYPILDILKERWSPRTFANQAVEPEKLWSLFEAARWSPSAGNAQPWAFIVTFKGEPAHEKLASTLMGRNLLWATQAPVLILTLAQRNYAAGQPYRHALYDLGQSVAHLTVQASASGLHVHQMGGFDAEKARQLFDVPESHEVVTLITVGYLGNPDALPGELRERELAPRTRKELATFVFAERFGEPLTKIPDPAFDL
jgi:nitroreductase